MLSLLRLSRFLVRVFFREIVLEGQENLSAAGPVLFTPNHPNALLDPLLMQLFSPPFTIRFVAKAPLFKIPIFGSMLRSLGAIPVVRRIDVNQDVDYTAFFSACVDALGRHDSIVIFPEGRSLPQPYLAPLRTGPARLFFLARERNINVQVIPVGLNYERGYVFRSSVLISTAKAISTEPFEQMYATDSAAAIRGLTDEITNVLNHHVFQTETYRDRELMLLLERLYSRENRDDSWTERFERLRVFESALRNLNKTHPAEIDRMRHLLARYERISRTFNLEPGVTRTSNRSFTAFAASTGGTIIAAAGWLLNIIPYKLVDLLIKILRKDVAEAATFKIVFGMFLFPLNWILQTIAVQHWFGWEAAIVFAVLILPLTYFTLRFFEWREEIGHPQKGSWLGFDWNSKRRADKQLQRLRTRIISEVETLAESLRSAGVPARH
jgi:1-acyl-sn-glycerol-3-phosphate acyltransferase